MKLKIAAFVVITFLGCLWWYVLAHHQDRTHVNELTTPYETASQLISTIKQLPSMCIVGRDASLPKWDAYIVAAKKIQFTDPTLTQEALSALTSAAHPFEDEVKTMLLLRVCFECPSGQRPSRADGKLGGWISGSAYLAGRPISDDFNWPLVCKSGNFYLTDTINGHHGSPYDPAAEFDWMRTNCIKRKL